MKRYTGNEVLKTTCLEVFGGSCRGTCADSTRQERGGRWYITMGHPGFNSVTNNRQGYASKEMAAAAVARFGRQAVR